MEVMPRKPNPQFVLRRFVWRPLVVVLVLAAIVAGPYAVFYLKYLRPTTPIPAVDDAKVEQIAPLDAAMGRRLTAVLVESRRSYGLPSLSAAVGYAEALQWAAATGYADIERGTPAGVTSRYRIGSASKALTGVLLARLIDRQVIDIDAPITTYYPTAPRQYASVTARQLASHTAGVRHYAMPSWWMANWENYSNVHFESVETGLSMVSGDRLLFQPGTDFKYSTFGYSLLARAMEGAGGADFGNLLTKELLQPAGMTDTAVDVPTAMPRRVSFYNADSGRYRPAIPINSSYKVAGGGLVSTPSDLVVLGLQLLDDRLLSEGSRRLMFTPVPVDGRPSNPENYGLGWRMNDSTRLLGPDRPVRIVHHGGVQPGGACFYGLLPNSGLVMAVCTNSGTGAARDAVQEVAYELVRTLIAAKAVPG